MLNKENIAEALKRYRVQRDITLSDMAKKIGIAPSTLQKIENGEHRPNDRTLYKILSRIKGLTSNAA